MTAWRAACGAVACACAAAVACACAAAFAAPHATCRLVVVLTDETVVWVAPVSAGERFDLSFRHSSEYCRWTHRYETVAAGWIHQLGSAFPCYGAGMPIDSTDGSPVTRSADGFEVAAPLELGRVPLINSRPAAISLRYRARDIAIGDLVPEMAAFAIEVR